MKLYQIEFDYIKDYVEAESFAAAIEKWQRHVIANEDADPGVQPESVACIADSDEYVDRAFVVIR